MYIGNNKLWLLLADMISNTGCICCCRAGQLDSKLSTAVVHYLLQILPQLHDDSSIPAASLLLCILPGPATPTQLLQSAVTTLQHLPLTSQTAHKTASQTQSTTSKAAASSSKTQVSSEKSQAGSSVTLINGSGVESQSLTASVGQVQLACELLQSFTAEAFAGWTAPKGRGKAAKAAVAGASDGFEVLLHLLRSGVEGQQANGRDQLVKLRLAAFQRLGAELYGVMPVQQQMQAFLVGHPYC